MKLQSGTLQLLLYGGYEVGNIGIAALLRGIQLLLDVVVGIVLQIFQREVLQFRLQLIEAQLVGQGGIEIGRLLRHAPAGIVVLGIAYLPHQADTVGNHNKYHAHVFGKRQQQVAEVLTLNDGVFLVEFLYALQTVKNAGHRLAERLLHVVNGREACLDAGVKQDGQHGIAAQAYFLNHYLCRLQTGQYGVQPKHVATRFRLFHVSAQVQTHILLVALNERRTNGFLDSIVKQECLFALLGGKYQSFRHEYQVKFCAKVQISA